MWKRTFISEYEETVHLSGAKKLMYVSVGMSIFMMQSCHLGVLDNIQICIYLPIYKEL